ncbi:RmlC-like cupin domain-containing protein [Fimicolochytrium jonesii]|uniref:RmlC-like cupin domain-containing protein n=1 Tax=Fimicolochytrium jonesii TaxID=1396493 RepID=UPI0022FE8F5C|nr:RmlC-like cupin domain-containing protein [Fimicolochytrium jonesii]KAI8815727.1 RmlC-like cupin domain-containing protein [Fimicolochytrium jonesii]
MPWSVFRRPTVSATITTTCLVALVAAGVSHYAFRSTTSAITATSAVRTFSSPATGMAKFRVRKSDERGHADHGWLDSYHTFSFANYYDPKHVEFGPLRVLNEDRVTPRNGFGSHPHKEFEIFSYIVSGALEHKDSLGNIETLPRGTIQHTSAGTGLSHSEYNAPGSTAVCHFLQLWLKPHTSGLSPSYVTKEFSDAQKEGRLLPVLYPHPSVGKASGLIRNVGDVDTDSLIPTHADAFMFASILRPGDAAVEHRPVGAGRRFYVHVIMRRTGGSLVVNGGDVVLGEGDGVFVTDVHEKEPVRFESRGGVVEFVLLDLA